MLFNIIINFGCYVFNPILRILRAFCTILPFYLGCWFIFFKGRQPAFCPLKTHFLTTISPFPAMFFMVLKGFIYTVAVYFYAFRLVFSTISPCV